MTYMKRLITFFLMPVVLLLCLTAVPLQAEVLRDNTGFQYQYISGRKYYRVYDIANYMRLRLYKRGSSYELYGTRGRMVFTPDKRYGSFNGTVLNYDFVPTLRGGELYISSSDFFNHLQVLFLPVCLSPLGIRTILIDPGHGGVDIGASGVMSREKDLTLQIALRLQRILNKMGYRVYVTRNTDRKIELVDRARAGNSIKADLFISIHMNAAANRSVRGIETFALTAPGAPSSGSSKVGYDKHPGNSALWNSYALAWNVQNQLVTKLNAADRGVKQARFVVLRESRCPSILIECGFISNRYDEKLLNDPKYQEKLALSIAWGIYNYHVSLRRR